MNTIEKIRILKSKSVTEVELTIDYNSTYNEKHLVRYYLWQLEGMNPHINDRVSFKYFTSSKKTTHKKVQTSTKGKFIRINKERIYIPDAPELLEGIEKGLFQVVDTDKEFERTLKYLKGLEDQK